MIFGSYSTPRYMQRLQVFSRSSVCARECLIKFSHSRSNKGTLQYLYIVLGKLNVHLAEASQTF